MGAHIAALRGLLTRASPPFTPAADVTKAGIHLVLAGRSREATFRYRATALQEMVVFSALAWIVRSLAGARQRPAFLRGKGESCNSSGARFPWVNRTTFSFRDWVRMYQNVFLF
jgi:hypothetical protein